MGGMRPAQQRFDTRQQFREREGLRNIVIAAMSQTPHALVGAGQGAHDQCGGTLPKVAQLADDRQTVDPAR
jgi:hypothetical protein